MVERRQTQRLVFIMLFLGLAALVTFTRLLPLGGYGSGVVGENEQGMVRAALSALPMPDILLCLTLAWVVRRPDLLPAPVIAGYFFFEDILLLRPPGLWALIVLFATEWLRGRSEQMRGYGFGLEYMVIVPLLLVMFVANRAVLAFVMIPLEPLGLSLAHLLGTIVIYPGIVAVSHFVFGLRKPATGEVDALGQRL